MDKWQWLSVGIAVLIGIGYIVVCELAKYFS